MFRFSLMNSFIFIHYPCCSSTAPPCLLLLFEVPCCLLIVLEFKFFTEFIILSTWPLLLSRDFNLFINHFLFLLVLGIPLFYFHFFNIVPSFSYLHVLLDSIIGICWVCPTLHMTSGKGYVGRDKRFRVVYVTGGLRLMNKK